MNAPIQDVRLIDAIGKKVYHMGVVGWLHTNHIPGMYELRYANGEPIMGEYFNESDIVAIKLCMGELSLITKF